MTIILIRTTHDVNRFSLAVRGFRRVQTPLPVSAPASSGLASWTMKLNSGLIPTLRECRLRCTPGCLASAAN